MKFKCPACKKEFEPPYSYVYNVRKIETICPHCNQQVKVTKQYLKWMLKDENFT